MQLKGRKRNKSDVKLWESSCREFTAPKLFSNMTETNLSFVCALCSSPKEEEKEGTTQRSPSSTRYWLSIFYFLYLSVLNLISEKRNMESQDSIRYCEQKTGLQSNNGPVRISQGRPFTIALSHVPSFGIQGQSESALSIQIQQCGGSADGQDVTQYFLKHPDKDRIRYLVLGITCHRWKLYPQSASSKIAAHHRRQKSHFSVEKKCAA